MVDKISVGYGLGYEVSSSSMIGLSKTHRTLVKNTFGVEQTYSGEIAVPDLGLLSAKFGANLKNNWNFEIATEYSETQIEQKQDIVKFNKLVVEAERIFLYRLVEEYKLYRINSDIPVVEWDITTDKNQLFLSYPHSKIEKGNQFKSTSMVENSFFQSESEDLIPRMYSNTSPTGLASASSSYSSTYYPSWKAFDAEDESGSWSRWISQPAGTFTGQWLAYEFEEPITIMAYNITPETGGCINRTPNSWYLQAWNGSYWQTLDSRSGYTITDWQSEYSRKFTIQYPKKYKKYRLYVEHVNGSNVVSIRKFKIFGLDNNGGLLKSGMVTSAEHQISNVDESIDIKLTISPNPNQGIFTLRLHGIENIGNQNVTDSLSIANMLKSGIDLDQIHNQKDILIELFDLNGNKIYSDIIHNNLVEMNLCFLSKGIYIVKAIINRENIVTERVIIE